MAPNHRNPAGARGVPRARPCNGSGSSTAATGARPTGITKSPKKPRRISQPPLCGLYNEVVTVRVIPEEGDGDAKEFLIYRKLAAHYSTFFAEIFGENGPPKMKLDSVNTRIFELFVQFLNARRFEYRWRAWVDANQDPYFPLVKLYELAERLGAIALMNQVISKIRNVFQDSRFKLFVSISVINYIYEKTNKGAPLRRVVRDMFAFHSDTSTLKYSKTTPIHREFDSDLRTRLILRTQKPEVVEPADDQYHLDEIPEDEDECAIVENAQTPSTMSGGS